MTKMGLKSKEKIIKAAIEIFAAKGKHGATMDEIATRAGINKAMLYYYFGDKSNLFRQTLLYIFVQIFKQVLGTASKKRQKVSEVSSGLEGLLRRHFRLLANRPVWARLIFYSLINEEEDLKWAIQSLTQSSPQTSPFPLLSLIEKGIAEGKFRQVDPKQTVVSIAGANLIYFLGRPVAKILLDLKDEEEESFMRQREESVVDLIFHGLLKEKIKGNQRGNKKLYRQDDKKNRKINLKLR